MEGERILGVLKKRSESFESISKDVKVAISIFINYIMLPQLYRVGTFSIPCTDIPLSRALRKEAKKGLGVGKARAVLPQALQILH